jgi:Cu2+-exporting ATPase
VTCPCAIGLATPLAHELALLRLRKRALLPRHPDLLERARAIRHVVFDKTGTLTLTEPRLDDPDALAALDPGSAALLAQLAARSNHPKSRALTAAMPPVRLDETLVVEELPGVGLRASVGDTHYALVGDGRDLVFSRGADALARFRFDETLRPDAAAEVARLHDAGLTVHIASGDADANVARIAERLRIPPERAHAQLSPTAKADLVAALGARETLVLGDGINDVLAFDAAAVSGTPAIDRPILPARADFVLLGSSLGPLAELVAVARQTHRITRRNAAIAGVYNVLALAAGLAGWLSPIVAAVAMPLSSVAVIALTFAAQRPPSTRRSLSRKGAPLWMPSI